MRSISIRWAGAAACLVLLPAQDIQIEKVETKMVFADGPVWVHDGFLLVSDVPASRILRITPGAKTAIFREKSNGAAGMALDAQGRLYVCETHTRRVTRTDRRGNIETIAERWQGKRFNAPNDIAIRKDGNVYFTDPAFGSQQDRRELDFNGVFRLDPKGELSLIAKFTGRPNGIALAPNGRTLYVTNSDEKNLRAYDLDKTGAASNERTLVAQIEGVPNGIRTDEKGNLYVAAKSIFVFDPAGKPIRSIVMGETPSNLAWGDADGQSLYITARTSVYRVRLDAKGPVSN